MDKSFIDDIIISLKNKNYALSPDDVYFIFSSVVEKYNNDKNLIKNIILCISEILDLPFNVENINTFKPKDGFEFQNKRSIGSAANLVPSSKTMEYLPSSLTLIKVPHFSSCLEPGFLYTILGVNNPSNTLYDFK